MLSERSIYANLIEYVDVIVKGRKPGKQNAITNFEKSKEHEQEGYRFCISLQIFFYLYPYLQHCTAI